MGVCCLCCPRRQSTKVVPFSTGSRSLSIDGATLQKCPTVESEFWRPLRSVDVLAERQALLMKLSMDLAKEKKREKFLKMFVSASRRLLNCDNVLLFLASIDNDGAPLVCYRYPTLRPSDDNETIELDKIPSRDQGIVGKVWATGATENIANARDHVVGQTVPQSEESTEDLFNVPVVATSVLCIPLSDANGIVYGVLKAVNKHSSEDDERPKLLGGKKTTFGYVPFDDADETMMTMLSSLALQQLLTLRSVRAKAERARSKFDAMLCVLQEALSATDSQALKRLIHVILYHSQIIFECDRCSLYAIDTLQGQLICYELSSRCSTRLGIEDCSDFDLGERLAGAVKEYRLPMSHGCIGIVARTGTALNLQDAWNDERFNRDTDLERGRQTTTLLMSPLITSNGKVVAVMRCANKFKGFFSNHDENELAAISALVADRLHRILIDATLFACLEYANGIDDDVKDRVREFKAPSEETELLLYRQASTTNLHLSRSHSKSFTGESMACLKKMKRWDFDHWSLDEQRKRSLGPCIYSCFDAIGLLGEYCIPQTAVDTCVNAFRNRYSKEVAYHSWEHAFSTFHISFIMLECQSLLSVLPPLDVLALLLAALGHDVEHEGVNNAFLINKRHMLALRYNDISVLENHHASITCGILEDFVSRYSSAHAPRFRKVLVQTILATDMAKHHETVKWLQTEKIDIAGARESEVLLDPEHALKLCSTILHSADLAHPTLPWDIHRKLSICCCVEFFAQYQEEQRLGLSYLPFMGKNPNNLPELAPTQVGFIRFVVVPLWIALDQAIPGEKILTEAIKTMQSNQEKWHRIEQNAEEQDTRSESSTEVATKSAKMEKVAGA